MMRQHLLVSGGNEIHLIALEHEQLHLLESFPSGPNPTFLAKHPHKSVVYASNEVEQGTVEAFSFAPQDLRLTRLGSPVSTHGSTPAAISVHPSGKWLFFVNYKGSSYGVVGIDDESGMLLPQHGHIIEVPAVPVSIDPSKNIRRQEAPHPHHIITDSSGKLVFVCDLGLDKIHAKVLEVETGNLKAHTGEEFVVQSGSGPRHMIFSHDERFAYVINELSNTVSQFSYDRSSGGLSFLQSWSTLDDTVPNKSACTAAEVALSPDGKFLYASNRGGESDTIAVFKVGGDGALNLLGLDPVGGSGPRHFAFDKSGEWVRYSNKVNLLSRNVETGRLSVVSGLDGVKAPAFALFL